MHKRIPKKQINKIMKEADIPGVSIAMVNSKGIITPIVFGIKEKDSKDKVTPETVFGAASLSKPVFAYLVLKLINYNQTGEAKGLGQFNQRFNLDTPLYKIFPDLLKKFRKEDEDKANQLTARMMLSHTSGLPTVHHSDEKPIEFQFEPGTQYGYSGPGIALLQEVIEALTGPNSNLEALAKKHIFSKEALDMQSSSFHHDKSKPPQAANSLYTTPSDYTKIINA